jgi:hypothetical protein
MQLGPWVRIQEGKKNYLLPDPDSLEMLDPNPYPESMNPNPQHCLSLSK